jgi:hypothetical protein
LFAAAVLVAALFASAAPTGADASSLKAILEVDRDAYYAGDPVPVRLSIWNDSGIAVPAPSGEVPAGFELFDIKGRRSRQWRRSRSH